MRVRAFLIGTGIVLGCAVAQAATVTEIRVTTQTAEQYDPAVSIGKVVWTDTRNGNADIYLYDIATGIETQVTSETHGQFLPAINGSMIAYADDRAGPTSFHVYAFDLATGVETRITPDAGEQVAPAVSPGFVVWEDFQGGMGTVNVWAWDRTTPVTSRFPVSPSRFPQIHPSISGNVVVWAEYNGFVYDIAMRDLTTPGITFLTNSTTSNCMNPDIDGDSVVYMCDRAGNWDIFLYDLATNTETQITNDPADQSNPRISGNRIAWEDYRNPGGQSDLYGYDISTGTEMALATGPSRQRLASISGPDIAFTDDRFGNDDIFVLHTAEEPTDPCDPASGALVFFDEVFRRHHHGPDHARHHDGGGAYRRLFEVPAGIEQGTMCVGVEGHVKAWIDLNHVPVFRPADFTPGATSLEKEVQLRPVNYLRVKVEARHRGRRGDPDADDDGHPDAGQNADDHDQGDNHPIRMAIHVRVVGPVGASAQSNGPWRGPLPAESRAGGPSPPSRGDRGTAGRRLEDAGP